MKFSVWDYSQVKIAQFNQQHPHLAIDPTDIFIFTWFKGFANKTRAKKTKKDGTQAKGMWYKTIDNVDYFNVRYDAIIKDFPILGVCNIKSIQRRFDKYVEAGIFEKTIVHAGKKGNFTYFAFTDLFLSFEYDDDNPEHKEQTKPVSVDKNVQTKQVSVDKNVQTLIYNPITSLKNPTTSSSYTCEEQVQEQLDNNLSKQQEEEVFLQTIINLFGYNPGFNPNPYPVLFENFKKFNLDVKYLVQYLTWIFKKLKPKCKNPEDYVSYFFKSFTQAVYISQYKHEVELEEQKKIIQQENRITCPVCGTVHDKRDLICPNENCKLTQEYLDSPEDLLKEQVLYRLKTENKEKYKEYQDEMEKLYNNIPFFERVGNREKQTEFENLLSEIENKFLNINKSA